MATLASAVPAKVCEDGDSSARALYDSAYSRLRFIAAALLRRERRGHTLQPTALVGELFLKLRGFDTRTMTEDHFYGLAARAMRQVLIDHARVRKAVIKVDPASVPHLLADRDAISPEMQVSTREVFRKLAKLNAQVAETVWLRSVEGLTLNEVSARQTRDVWRVRADFDFGIKWMAERIRA
ncbi:MAG: ECF-type sigma factor [Bryobacteraceae bacterium]